MDVWTFKNYYPPAPLTNIPSLRKWSPSSGDILAERSFYSGPGNWSMAKTKFITSGDYNDDALDDIAAMYDYGNNTMAIWIFFSLGDGTYLPFKSFQTNPGAWSVTSTKHLVSGDIDFDGFDDIYAIYDYGNYKMGITVFDQPVPWPLIKKALWKNSIIILGGLAII